MKVEYLTLKENWRFLGQLQEKMQKQSSYYMANQTAAIDMLLIAFLWLASLSISNPNGDFPLNDDWSYALAVKHLLEDGYFHQQDGHRCRL